MNIWALLEYTAAVTVIGLLICLIKLVFHDKLDARWHFFIWLVLLVRLVVPGGILKIPVSLSVFQELPIGKWLEMARILVEKNGLGELFALLGRIYVWGAILLGISYLALWLLLRIQVARAPKADPQTRDYVAKIAAKYGLKSCRDIRIRKTGTPYICGVFSPVLVLPEGNERPPEQVILHELLHRKYKDVLVNIALHVARVFHWWNPLVWFLTSLVQNDSEALCDQRVLEYCGQRTAPAYGNLLITIGEGNRKNPVKIGTSNMASSYRNMKTRIRRIRDFGKVPKKIGLVTLCVTLMLAVAGIGTSAEENYFEIPQMETERDLERALLYARCYHAHTPEEAVYLFLRSCEERSLLYRMAVMPESKIPEYETFAGEWFRNQDLYNWGELEFENKPYPDYFPKNIQPSFYRIYNLQYGEETGSATVCEKSLQQSEPVLAEWKLSLRKDQGWTVWLEEERQLNQENYVPEPFLYGSRRLGEFQVEVLGYNEGYFQQLDGQFTVSFHELTGQQEKDFPQFFSVEYKYMEANITYLGEESLEDSSVHIFLYGKEGMEEDAECIFRGSDFENEKTLSIIGGGTGYAEPGWCWKTGDQIGVEAAIYVNGNLMEAGEIWSEDR